MFLCRYMSFLCGAASGLWSESIVMCCLPSGFGCLRFRCRVRLCENDCRVVVVVKDCVCVCVVPCSRMFVSFVFARSRKRRMLRAFECLQLCVRMCLCENDCRVVVVVKRLRVCIFRVVLANVLCAS